ncbi:MAG TPA: DUF4390 domain-containing protein [Xanthomonadales bacterium]|nr:DUF4390 domain-containing protein [Xanthomonadales bacterium]
MPTCTNAADQVLKLSCLFSLLLLLGCSDRNGDFGFELTGLKSRISGQQLKVELKQNISLSPDARAALENGVPLHIEIRAELDAAAETITAFRRFEIRYMPLSDHYQLSSAQPAWVRTFPRLRHALAELSEVELDLPLENVAAGEYQLSARSWLEKRRLPAPMRLPAWFSPNWQHDSGWQSWPVSISATAASSGELASS